MNILSPSIPFLATNTDDGKPASDRRHAKTDDDLAVGDLVAGRLVHAWKNKSLFHVSVDLTRELKR
jgi:hypothetical protein